MRVVRHKADKQTDSASRVTDKGRGSILRSRVARRAAPPNISGSLSRWVDLPEVDSPIGDLLAHDGSYPGF